jgi:tetratricopeptide (TPR) repeat protein
MLPASTARFILTLAGAIALSNCVPHPSTADLQRLYDDHQWFKLNAAVQSGQIPPFFHAAVQCVLNRTQACEHEMAEVIRDNHGNNFEYEAYSQMTALYLRQGRYRRALEQTEAMLRLRPADSDAQNTTALLKAAGVAPDQQVAHPGHAHVPWADPGKSLEIPVSIDGTKVEYSFDTGANLSTISDADARRLNLAVRSNSATVYDSVGQQAHFQIATADKLEIGDFEVANVAFLVFPASQEPFNEMPPLTQGVLGISPFLAARRVSWSPSSGLDLGLAQNDDSNAAPNMVFEGQDIVALADFENTPVLFHVDSGSEWTVMYPRFAENHAAYINAHGTRTKHKYTGFGGAVNADVMHLPELAFSIAGVTDRVPGVNVLLQSTEGFSKLFDGTLGADTMRGPHSFSFDFDSMRLTIH